MMLKRRPQPQHIVGFYGGAWAINQLTPGFLLLPCSALHNKNMNLGQREEREEAQTIFQLENLASASSFAFLWEIETLSTHTE